MDTSLDAVLLAIKRIIADFVLQLYGLRASPRRTEAQAPRSILWELHGHLAINDPYGADASSTMRARFAAFAALLLFAPSASLALDANAVNDAQWQKKSAAAEGISPALVKAQVLLDRAHFSPGEIDGKLGDNVKKAVAAFAQAADLTSSGAITEAVWQQLTGTSSDPIITDYTISDEDVRGPFLPNVPAKMEEMKDLPALSYASAREKIAEKFHMSEALLSALNPGQTFDKAGDRISVANVAAAKLSGKAARLEVDKTAQTLKV